MGNFSKEVNATFESDYIKASLNIKYTAQYLSALSNKALEPFQISSQQYNILRILRGAKKPITMQMVKDRMIEKSPNTTRLSDKLYDKGLIERIRCEHDRRVVYVSILPKGLAILEEIKFDKMEASMKRLTENEAIQLNELLDKLRD